MINEKSLAWGRSKSCIRELAGYASARKAEIGIENVFDFSIGNPSVPAPPQVNDTIRALLDNTDSTMLHGYTPAPGLPSLRKAIADDLNKRYDANIIPEMVYVCCGAAAGLCSSIRALLCDGDEVIAFAPFFAEYTVFTEAACGRLLSVPPMDDMQPDISALESAITEKTKILIINTPNNPSGVLLTEDSLNKIADVMRKAQEKYGHSIYLLSDEPYRELVFDGVSTKSATRFYDNTIICYSFSKSLSLPGERIGYVAVSSTMAERQDIFDAICGAARGYGYVNAPSLMQRVVENCMGLTSDISAYKRNRDILYKGLSDCGFDCIKPDGAFYLFVKSPEPDAKAFSERAKKYELMLVPGDDFGVKGYVRLAYCVSEKTIVDSMPSFKKLAEEYGL
ncbi:MAG: pyridoxal phosphate-dependent aminotransferase [Oscillospiraceae bacterium]|nr:pyridoxal phosphate-dependent aminotransferase [Oscillospiraceae bacterium]